MYSIAQIAKYLRTPKIRLLAKAKRFGVRLRVSHLTKTGLIVYCPLNDEDTICLLYTSPSPRDA